MAPGSSAEWAVPALFTYGLLRPGEVYWSRLEPAVRRVRPARVRGALHLHASGEYPMLVVDADGWVHGDLLDVDDLAAVHGLVFMELTAGYDARWVSAEVEDEAVPAIAFSWPWGALHRGPRVPSGDWRRR